MSKWRFILIKNMFLLTFKISNNFRTKNLQIEHSACHCTDACGIQRSFVVNFFVTRSKILDQSGLPSCPRLSVEIRSFPEKKFDFKIVWFQNCLISKSITSFKMALLETSSLRNNVFNTIMSCHCMVDGCEFEGELSLIWQIAI